MTRPDQRRVPDALLDAVKADQRRVRADPVPWRRAATWLPLAILAVVMVPVVGGPRFDLPVLGPVLGWGGSIFQVALAGWMVWVAGREGVPGSRLPSVVAALGLVVGAAAVVGLTTLTFAASPTTLPAQVASIRAGSFCYRGTLAVGAPLLLGVAWGLTRWMPIRPWLTGALAGMGAGLAADAGWRLICPISDPAHVLTGHSGAVVTLTAIGGLAAGFIARRRRTGLR